MLSLAILITAVIITAIIVAVAFEYVYHWNKDCTGPWYTRKLFIKQMFALGQRYYAIEDAARISYENQHE